MWRSKYQRHQVGAGWVDPGRLGSRLQTGLHLLAGRPSDGVGWLGAISLSLVILSWWNDMSVREVFTWLADCTRNFLG